MRLFIGIDLPSEIKQALLELQSELRNQGVNGSWKSKENFHLTLEFLGELDMSTVPTICECLAKASRSIKPFPLRIGGLGVFPSFKRPHTLWTSVDGRLNELHQLRDRIHSELASQGFNLEERKFKPHITLASRPKLNDEDLSDLRTKEFGEFRVEEIILFKSEEVRGNRLYTALERLPLV